MSGRIREGQQEIDSLTTRVRELEELLNTKYQTVARSVFETVKDAAATWDTACDELIYYSPEGPEHQPVSEAHLAAICTRFPQWASELRSLAARWNVPEGRLTDEEMAGIEVSPEEVERSTRSALRLLKWHDRIRAAKNQLAATKVVLSELVRLKKLKDEWTCETESGRVWLSDEALADYAENQPLAWQAAYKIVEEGS